MMTHTERVKRVIRGEATDRPVFTAWGPHANLEDRDLNDFVKYTINYQEYNDFDIVKVMPNGLYHTEDYGQIVRWGENDDDASYRNTIKWAMNSLEDWKKVPRLDMRKGAYAREIEVVRRISDHFQGDVPVLPTVFGPGITAVALSSMLTDKSLAGKYIEDHAAEFKSFAEAITENNIRLMEAYLDAGAAGFFYAQWGANLSEFTPDQFETFIKPYDITALNAVKDRSWFTMLHVCGQRIFMDKVLDYPVTAFNWDDQCPLNPSLKQVRMMTDKVLVGGLDKDHDFVGSNRAKIKEIVRNRIEIGIKAAGSKYIVSGGCEWGRNAAHRLPVLTEVIEEMGREVQE